MQQKGNKKITYHWMSYARIPNIVESELDRRRRVDFVFPEKQKQKFQYKSVKYTYTLKKKVTYFHIRPGRFRQIAPRFHRVTPLSQLFHQNLQIRVHTQCLCKKEK